MTQLILSIFPGIDLLGLAFEQEGFCVVRGPDLLWGGDIHNFHVMPGHFDGIIGGPPCQAFSRLRFVVQHNGYQLAENLIPEFERCVAEAQPTWFLMENVEGAPEPRVPGNQDTRNYSTIVGVAASSIACVASLTAHVTVSV
jgi:DNA (cytosine-5)-methyltransferase 1